MLRPAKFGDGLPEPMRVGFLTNNHFPPREGIARHIYEIASRLQAYGIQPWVIAKGTQRRGWTDSRIGALPVSHYPYLGLRPFHQKLMQRTLQGWCDGPGRAMDLVHIHMPLIPMLALRQQRIVTVHSPLLSDTGAIPERDWRARLIKLNARMVSRHIEQHHLDEAHRLIAVSHGVAAELRGDYAIGDKSIDIITNGVDTRFFPYIRGHRRQHRLLYVGRLGYRKGLGRLLDSIALLGDRRLALDLAGEGPLQARLQRKAERLGIADRVNFVGFVDRNQLRERMKSAAALINPADYETGPLTLLEAMAAGTPVITTPTGIARELGNNPPVLVAHADAPSLTAAIERLLSDPDGARERALAARALVEQRFDWDQIVARLVEFYQQPERLAA